MPQGLSLSVLVLERGRESPPLAASRTHSRVWGERVFSFSPIAPCWCGSLLPSPDTGNPSLARPQTPQESRESWPAGSWPAPGTFQPGGPCAVAQPWG